MDPIRKRLPDRRRTWTQKVRVGGQLLYLTVGMYEDGRPGELFIVANKLNTFARGILDSLARTASLALQCGAPLEEVVQSLRGLSFPPDGPVVGSPNVTHATSIADFIAQELEATYRPAEPPPEKVAGAITGSPDWYVGKPGAVAP